MQKKLAQKVIIPRHNLGYYPKQNDIIFSLDAHYVKDRAYIALDVQKWKGKIVGTYIGITNVEIPYVPQFFCFREGPVLLEMLKAAKKRLSLQPKLIIVDGHGIAHPRRFGVACWIGVNTDIPSIGCAKETLVRYNGEIDKKRGNYLFIKDKNEIIGAVLVTQDNTKPVFVSPGHRVSLKVAIEVILNLSPRFRISEPLRRADQSAKAYAKEMTLEGVTFWGEIMNPKFCRRLSD
ncbi:MAG: endonuclease V [Deltaproteobacteria bacterium]|nr:endonuclease V [Deltaproteobacteria bacterium]